MSWAWKGFSRDLDFMKEDFAKCIGNDKGTNVVMHTWFLNILIAYKYTFFISSDAHTNLTVSDLLQDYSWNATLIYSLGGPSLATVILNTRLLFTPRDDFWIWREDCVACSLIKTVYRFLLNGHTNLDDLLRGWKALWKLLVPLKIKFFG